MKETARELLPFWLGTNVFATVTTPIAVAFGTPADWPVYLAFNLVVFNVIFMVIAVIELVSSSRYWQSRVAKRQEAQLRESRDAATVTPDRDSASVPGRRVQQKGVSSSAGIVGMVAAAGAGLMTLLAYVDAYMKWSDLIRGGWVTVILFAVLGLIGGIWWWRDRLRGHAHLLFSIGRADELAPLPHPPAELPDVSLYANGDMIVRTEDVPLQSTAVRLTESGLRAARDITGMTADEVKRVRSTLEGPSYLTGRVDDISFRRVPEVRTDVLDIRRQLLALARHPDATSRRRPYRTHRYMARVTARPPSTQVAGPVERWPLRTAPAGFGHALDSSGGIRCGLVTTMTEGVEIAYSAERAATHGQPVMYEFGVGRGYAVEGRPLLPHESCVPGLAGERSVED